MKKSEIRLYINRFLLILGLSIAAVWLVSELGILLQQDENTARAPMMVEFVIPAGTAAKVEAGEEAPSIPDDLTFVLGDVLVVRNDDAVAHIFGPLLVPPGTSASMPLNEADHFSFACSFTPSRFIGLNVKSPTTLTTRFLGIAFAAPPTAVMIYVYSLIVFPFKPQAESGAVPSKSGS